MLESGTWASSGPHSSLHRTGMPQQLLELVVLRLDNKDTKKLGSVMLEAKPGQALGSFTGPKVDECKGSPGNKKEIATPTTTTWHLLDDLSPKC